MQPLVPTLKAHLRVLNQSFSPFHVRHRHRCNHSHQTCSQLKLQHCSAARLTAYSATVIYAVLTALPQRNELLNVCTLQQMLQQVVYCSVHCSIDSVFADRSSAVCVWSNSCLPFMATKQQHALYTLAFSLLLTCHVLKAYNRFPLSQSVFVVLSPPHSVMYKHQHQQQQALW